MVTYFPTKCVTKLLNDLKLYMLIKDSGISLSKRSSSLVY